MQAKTICVLGLGYIGLPMAALLAGKNYLVHGVDVNQNIVDKVNQGGIHIAEPELDTFVRAAVNSGNLKADTKPTKSDIFIIAVPTPIDEEFGPIVDFVISAVELIAPYLKEGDMVILESTSPIGTADRVEEILMAKGIDTSRLSIAYCPERVLPGKIIRELVENDRIVGGTTVEATDAAAKFYQSFVTGEVFKTDARTAEMAKLTENSFRDVNIAFANELSILCDQFNIDVWELIRLSNRHPRVNILRPGVGVGGHCIAVDPWFLIHQGGNDARIIRKAREVNIYKVEWAIEKIKNAALKFAAETGRKAKIACMGLSYKPNIDDLRESPALYVVEQLLLNSFDVLAVEPNIDAHPDIEIVNYQDAIGQADMVVFLVAHKEFYNLNIGTCLDFCGILAVDSSEQIL